jgi:hypothetical protein
MFEGDGLPSLICEQCSDLVSKFYDFKELSRNSDFTLRDHLQLQKLEGRKVRY